MSGQSQQQPQVQLPPVSFTAAGDNDDVREANLQMAQQIPGFADVTLLVADAIGRRAANVMMDFTAQAVGMKYEVDGMWHDLPPRDRQSGDALLASLKCLAGLNYQERRAKQSGKFKVQFMKVKGPCALTSQGVKTGERAILEMECSRPKLETLDDLGMREKMRDQFKELTGADSGIIVISSLPKGGLTSAWTGCLNATDRFMRDFVAIESASFDEPEILNVAPHKYNPAAGETAKSLIEKLALKEPDVFVVPELNDAETIGALCEQVSDFERMVYTRIHAKSAVEALARVLALKPPMEQFGKAVLGVVNVRLVRKLCETCRQPYQPTPQLLQQLGIPQGRIQAFYRPYVPQPTVDEKGNQIPPQICPQCQGVGYLGRTGIFELLVVDDKLREAIVSQPKLQVLQQVAKQSGHHSLQDQGILMVCQGLTSLEELQRVMQRPGGPKWKRQS